MPSNSNNNADNNGAQTGGWDNEYITLIVAGVLLLILVWSCFKSCSCCGYRGRKLPNSARKVPSVRADAILQALKGKWRLIQPIKQAQSNLPERYRLKTIKVKNIFTNVDVGVDGDPSKYRLSGSLLGKLTSKSRSAVYNGKLELFEDVGGEILYADRYGTEIVCFNPGSGVVKFKESDKLRLIWKGEWRRRPDTSTVTSRLVQTYFPYNAVHTTYGGGNGSGGERRSVIIDMNECGNGNGSHGMADVADDSYTKRSRGSWHGRPSQHHNPRPGAKPRGGGGGGGGGGNGSGSGLDEYANGQYTVREGRGYGAYGEQRTSPFRTDNFLSPHGSGGGDGGGGGRNAPPMYVHAPGWDDESFSPQGGHNYNYNYNYNRRASLV
eukprot:gene13612-5381_t